jgi:hypothetical protein
MSSSSISPALRSLGEGWVHLVRVRPCPAVFFPNRKSNFVNRQLTPRPRTRHAVSLGSRCRGPAAKKKIESSAWAVLTRIFAKQENRHSEPLAGEESVQNSRRRLPQFCLLIFNFLFFRPIRPISPIRPILKLFRFFLNYSLFIIQSYNPPPACKAKIP